ncbi:SDR family NAD(P)-dependent oxidoreductase [Chloroflexota bacterium]
MKNESVLITGSSRGLGEQLALVFSANNHDIILHGRNIENLGKIQNKIVGAGSDCFIITGDLMSDKTLDELNEIARQKDVSVLINNAGVSLTQDNAEEDLKLPLSNIVDNQIDELLTINLIAPVKLTRRLYTLFIDRGRGTIININSLLGLESRELNSLYCASKWGLRGFTDALRLEAEKTGIRIIGVYPSRIKTKACFTDGMDPRDVARKIYAAYISKTNDEIVLDGRPEK